ncbi:hypothetical protein I6M50_09520 [Shewanella algae]|nr:hypothetical protein [Shewanella algae]
MGWGKCGYDSIGRPIGYMFEATCDHHDCSEKINRGLSYACGAMHGNTEFGCEKYFCEKHLQNYVIVHGDCEQVCDSCAKDLLDSGEFAFDVDEGYIVAVVE